LNFSLPILEKYSNINFHENPSIGNKAVPYGRTDGWTEGGYDKANSHFSQFCEGVKKYDPHMNWATINLECTNRDSVVA